MRKTNREYDMALRSKAITGLCMRGAVAAYIIYLGIKLLSGVLTGESTIPQAAAIGVALVFAIGGAAFAVFAWRYYGKALREAEIPPMEFLKNDGADSDTPRKGSENE